jgi:lincosamide and streptogramin A transport system ATP-binding/permease protein
MQLEELLASYAPTLVFVEHDRAFCKRVATKTVAL